MDLKGFLADHLGHFSPYDIPGLLFSVLLAGLLAWAVGSFGAGLRGHAARRMALWAATAALGVALMRMQLPVALALLAILLVVRPQADGATDRLLLFGALIIGLGCGSGASLITAIATVPYVLLVRWAMPPASSSPSNVP